MATYTAEFFGDEYTMEADFAQAASPIVWNGRPTPYQVADFGHDSEEAFRALLERSLEAGGEDPDEYRDAIDDAVDSLV